MRPSYFSTLIARRELLARKAPCRLLKSPLVVSQIVAHLADSCQPAIVKPPDTLNT